MEIVQRKEALERGMDRYYTGKPCSRGHFDYRTVSRGCLECAREDDRKRYKADPDKRNQWKANNPDKVKIHRKKADAKRYMEDPRKIIDKNKKWYMTNIEKSKSHSRKYRGLPQPTRSEPKTCERCNKPESSKLNGKVKSLCLDHCHETGKFRGWLCSKCNTGIGLLGDTLSDLCEAVDYLKRFEDENV